MYEQQIKGRIIKYVNDVCLRPGRVILHEYNPENVRVAFYEIVRGGYDAYLLTADGAFKGSGGGNVKYAPIKKPWEADICTELLAIVKKFDPELGNKLAEIPPMEGQRRLLFPHLRDTSSPKEQETKKAIMDEIRCSNRWLFPDDVYFSLLEYNPKEGRSELAVRCRGYSAFSLLMTNDGSSLYMDGKLTPIPRLDEATRMVQTYIDIISKHSPATPSHNQLIVHGPSQPSVDYNIWPIAQFHRPLYG